MEEKQNEAVPTEANETREGEAGVQEQQAAAISDAPVASPYANAQPAPSQAPAQAQSTSGLAIAGLVLGILAILGAFVPLLNILTFPFAIVGLILAVVGLLGVNKGKHTGKGVAIAGIVLGAAALVVTIGMYGCAVAASNASSSSSSAATSISSSAASSSSASQASDTAQGAKSGSSEGVRKEFGGVSFILPETWVEVDADNGGKYYYPSANENSSLLHVLVSDVDTPEGEEESLLTGVIDGITGDVEDIEGLEVESTAVSGYAAKRATFRCTLNDEAYVMHCLAIALPGKVAMLLGGSPDGAYDAEFTGMLDSVEVVGSKKEEAPASSSTAEPVQEKPAAPAPEPAANGLIDADKFAAIKQGMTYEEVVALIGSEGKLLSQSSVAGIETADYQWESDGWGTATVMFQDGVVVNKTQFGIGGSDAEVTLEKFNAVETGMTYEQVVELFGGEGELLSETELAGITMAIYTWNGNTLLSTCQVTFENGAVSSKSQYGLE